MISECNVKFYCKDSISQIRNYELAINDKDNMWECHHILELHPDGTERFTRQSLISLNLYYNRPPQELIFLKQSEHRRLHMSNRIVSKETRDKLSNSRQGMKFSKEHKDNLSKSKKGNTNAKGNIRSEFGIKFFEHYGLYKSDDNKLYDKEYHWYKHNNNKCRWE